MSTTVAKAMPLLTTLSLPVLLVAGYGVLANSGLVELLGDRDALGQWVIAAGWRGPLLVIVLMAGAIVFSPLPSAPIALASGAAFGHGWGTLYIVIGAELGALLAFFVARQVGHALMRRWMGRELDRVLAIHDPTLVSRRWWPPTWLGSQNGLTAVVLVSRLLPFLSFDLVSYAAGLTRLTAARFALATLIGVVPISFLLAHFGDEFRAAEPQHLLTAALLLGVATVIPLFARWLWRRAQPGL